MATKKRQQTINKRNRERAIEEKRDPQAAGEAREARGDQGGEVEQPDWLGPPNEQLEALRRRRRPRARLGRAAAPELEVSSSSAAARAARPGARARRC